MSETILEQRSGLRGPRRLAAAAAVAASSLLAACSGAGSPSAHTETTSTTQPSDFRGGCEKYRVYAQNRWQPYGTAIRQAPDVLSQKIGGFAPNEVIAVNGWIEAAEPAYPTNKAPWNSKKWLHLANQDGWVSFAGVRGAPVSEDPTGTSLDGGPVAATPPNCEGTYVPPQASTTSTTR